VVNLEKQKKRVLVLCALPYTNGIPHIGNIVGSHLPADIFARFCRLKGYETLFIGGTDENGAPTEIVARELKISPKKLTDILHEIHKQIYEWLYISYDYFSRTSSLTHHKVTQEFFKKLYRREYISKKNLIMPYCEKDKLFLPDRYVEGKCPYCGYEHAHGDQCEKCTKLLDPDKLIDPKCKICGNKPVFKETKHLFFKLNKLEKKIEKWIESNRKWREHVRSLSLAWIKEGLKERCITRDLEWGVKVPLKGYENKVFYCWFDAPIGYLSFTIEWVEKNRRPQEWKSYWQDKNAFIVNWMGKDNIPFHTIFWPGMLIAHGDLNLPSYVAGLQYCNYEGSKISKSRGWGIFCEKLPMTEIDVDIWRFYFTFLIPETSDTNFRWEEFKNKVNNELIGNIGNFIYRTLSFIWKYFDGTIESGKLKKEDKKLIKKIVHSIRIVEKNLESFELRKGLIEILNISSMGNKYFQENKPWELIKVDKERCKTIIWICAYICKVLAILMSPYLPKTAERIKNQLNLTELKWKDLQDLNFKKKHKINSPEILFEKLTEEKIEKLKNIVTKPTPLEEFLQER